MAGTRMQRWFPGTSYPLIVSAPMAFVTNPRLATEVSKAGGLGFIQGGRDFAPGSSSLQKLNDQLRLARELLSHEGNSNSSATTTPLPIGVGFVTFAPSMQHFAATVAPILRRHRPAAVWFFAPEPAAHPESLAHAIRSLRSSPTTTTSSSSSSPPSPSSSSSSAAGEKEDRDHGWTPKIAVQVGSVAAAREAARLYGADIVVAQGADAGGHQFARAAGVVSLVPEIVDMLRVGEEGGGEEEGREVAVWAAGGIADGRGVAAALALGAEGAVLGTRYTVATESDAPDVKRKAVLAASDGGQSTVKSQLHDHVQGNTTWPDVYDGRAIVHPSYEDALAGVPIEENERRFRAAKESGDSSRTITWSGTGVGLIKKEQPAADITRDARDGALRVLSNLKSTGDS
ncbi:hypothetical protein SLS62_001843 [Diatrype stigma]|uniref:Nitronate monooxygenase domain-containing protein n=1 Tax=Diatrype stigma TaxID=117547 RepID=A0AAN9UVC2_9PEZI